VSNKTLHVNNFLSWIATRFIWLNLEGTWTKARAKWENNAGTWRCIQAALTVTAPNAVGVDSGPGTPGTVGATTTATANDAVGSISYAWVYVSGNAGTINNASIQSPSWSALVADGTPLISTWQVTVTDATTGATDSEAITVSLTWNSTD
jgi:hypothetical protein